MTAPGWLVVECVDGVSGHSTNAQFGVEPTGPAAVRQIGPMADGEPQFRALGPTRGPGRRQGGRPGACQAARGARRAAGPHARRGLGRAAGRVLAHGSPGQPLRSLQVYLSALRRAMGPEGRRLITVGHGYRLDVPDDGFDIDRFADGSADPAAASRRRPRDRLVAADPALALWRGQAWRCARDPRPRARCRAARRLAGFDLRATRAASLLALGVIATRWRSSRARSAGTHSARTSAAT